MPLQLVEISNVSDNQFMLALHNYSHIFRSLNFEIRFGIISETCVPIIVNSKLAIPEASPYVCLFGSPWKRDMSGVCRLFNGIEKRLLSLITTPAHHEDFEWPQLLTSESTGHVLRCVACFELDPVKRKQTFEKAYAVYEGIILALCHSSLTFVVKAVRKGSKQATLFQPFAEMESFSADSRRLISNCFAGMAICSLIGEGCPIKFVSLVSAAVFHEVAHSLELACMLRLLPLLMVLSNPLIDALTTLNIHRIVTEKIMLPLMLHRGRRDFFAVEMGLIEADRRKECCDFAEVIVKRIHSRQLSPLPITAVRTHIIDGKIIERNCAACGEWDRTGNTYSRCSGCMLVYYCCKACQLAHWKEHKVMCKKK
jgi:hypothetical protein